MTDAERLVVIADEVMRVRDRLIFVESPIPDNTVDIVALAIRLRKKPDVVLRAMVENWNRERIVRELY